jgi:hypothetical protein
MMTYYVRRFVFKYLILQVSEILTSLILILKQLMKKGFFELCIQDEYSKICLVLDEIIQNGICNQLETFYVKNYINLKYEEIKKKKL